MSSTAPQLAHLLRTRLKVKQLAVLCMIAEQGSIHRAATAQGLSQPAMSKILKGIEDAIGMPLFERSSSGLQVTRFGERLIFRARSLLTDIDQLALELIAIKEGYQGALRIGVIPLVSSAFLTRVIETLGSAGMSYTFSINVGSTDFLVEAVRSHNLDCVLARFPGTNYLDDLECRPIYAQKSCLVTSTQSVLNRHKGPIKLPDLKGYRWLLPQQFTPTRKAIDRIFLLAGRTPPLPAIECFDPRIIRFILAAQHDLVAILPREIAEEISAHGELIFFPIETEFSFPEVCLIKLRRAQEDPALTYFAQALEQTIETPAAAKTLD